MLNVMNIGHWYGIAVISKSGAFSSSSKCVFMKPTSILNPNKNPWYKESLSKPIRSLSRKTLGRGPNSNIWGFYATAPLTCPNKVESYLMWTWWALAICFASWYGNIVSDISWLLKKDMPSTISYEILYLVRPSISIASCTYILT